MIKDDKFYGWKVVGYVLSIIGIFIIMIFLISIIVNGISALLGKGIISSILSLIVAVVIFGIGVAGIFFLFLLVSTLISEHRRNLMLEVSKEPQNFYADNFPELSIQKMKVAGYDESDIHITFEDKDLNIKILSMIEKRRGLIPICNVFTFITGISEIVEIEGLESKIKEEISKYYNNIVKKRTAIRYAICLYEDNLDQRVKELSLHSYEISEPMVFYTMVGLEKSTGHMFFLDAVDSSNEGYCILTERIKEFFQ